MERTVLMAALLAAVTSLAAAAPRVFKPVPGSEYREQVDPPVPVSGLALVGLAIAGVPDLAKARQLYVYIGDRPPRPLRLRLEMTSADGRFRAHGLYEDVSEGNEWIALPIDPRESDPKAREHLARNTVELAVAVRPVTSGDTRVDTVLLASWGAMPAPQATRHVVLHVNSRRAEMSVRMPGRPDSQRCKPVRTAAAVRFDVVCTVEDWTPPPGESPPLLLQRRDGFDESTQRVQLR